MGDSTDDEFVSGGAEPSNRQSSHSAPNDTGAGRPGRWRCCSSGPPLRNTEAVEDVNDETSVQLPAADEKSVHSQKQQQKTQEPEEEDQEQCKGAAAGPRRWCSSSICSPHIEPATSDHTSAENSFTVQERHIHAAGGLQRLGSVHPDDEQTPTVPAPRPETEPTGDSETGPVPESEPESDATSHVESTQTDLGDGASLHRRNNSGFLKV